MGAYYEHTRTESVKLPYSFRCEQCMSDSGILNATITGSAVKDTIIKELSQKDEEKLRRRAHEDLVRTLKKLQENTAQKQVFPTIFSDECPHCHKPQSWGVSGTKEGWYVGPLFFLICGIIVAAVSLMGKEPWEINYENIPLAVGIAAVGAAAGVISLIWNIYKINKKKKIANTAAQKNLPVIQWESVQHLLNES